MLLHSTGSLEEFAPDAFRFYRRAREILQASGIEFLIGGAYAFGHYTGIVRYTKDLDIFIRPADLSATLEALSKAGYRTELLFTHWLGKAYHGEDFVDIIFSSGNGACPVDESWFTHAPEATVLGMRGLLMPAEEMIWQKAYIMERERFDGADVNHLLRARGQHLNWDRLLARFGSHWRLLLGHLILFGFVYPDDVDAIPPGVMATLIARLKDEPKPSENGPLCRGLLLSRMQYLMDLEVWGYTDPRRNPHGPMTREEVNRWTDAGR